MVPTTFPPRFASHSSRFLITLGYIVLGSIWTIAAACSSGTHVQAIVQHICYAVHIEILIRGRDLAQRSAHDAEITFELADHCGYLLCIGQHLNAARVRIIAHAKGTLNALGKGANNEEEVEQRREENIAKEKSYAYRICSLASSKESV